MSVKETRMFKLFFNFINNATFTFSLLLFTFLISEGEKKINFCCQGTLLRGQLQRKPFTL
uniref:Uncharacterized protein n=1 Tax=Meloidogyne enterolobii TaxID=390850 RepID=A0A6V7UUL2_MELEN|nr:unnamed protein product [Meloidogyne enterolobii]